MKQMSGVTSLTVDRCLTKQKPYVTRRNGKELNLNMRRINQLCLNLDSYRPETYFLYDYDFMWSFVHVFKMSDRLVVDSPFPEIRFLITQYKSCAAILDTHPDNFAFEMVSRLTPFLDVLPEFIYNLFQRCLRHCVLRRVESDTRLLTTVMEQYQLGVVNAICLGHCALYVFLAGKLRIFRFYARDWSPKISEYTLPAGEFTSVKFSSTDICFYSSQSILIFQKFDHQFGLHLNLSQIIYADFLHKEGLLVCSGDRIDVWHCLDKTLIGQYAFDAPILECSTIQRHMDAVIRVTLETGVTHYLITTNIQRKISFVLIATLHRKPEKRNIFLNFETDVYYSEDQSHIYLYYFERAEHQRLEKITKLPSLNRLVYRRSFFTDRHQSALIWLTVDSVVIFHSCGRYFNIPGKYDDIYSRCQLKRTFICCLNRGESVIDIYEWKLHERYHSYRLLVHLQLEGKVSHWVCQIGECSSSLERFSGKTFSGLRLGVGTYCLLHSIKW